MTREEAKKEILTAFKNVDDVIGYIDSAYLKNFIDEIYNNFDNKICKNCKYFEDNYCEKIYMHDKCADRQLTKEQLNEKKVIFSMFAEDNQGVYTEIYINENFGCNQFEQKELK